jgi:hypothetical protein
MLKNYSKESLAIVIAFSFISYSIYVCAEPTKTKPVVVTAKKEAAKPAEPAKKEHKKKPTLKAKYANKK